MKVKLNKAGVRDVLRSGEVMAALEAEANSRANSAGSGYGVNTYVGKNRCNAEVRAETREAIRDNLKNNTLARLL